MRSLFSVVKGSLSFSPVPERTALAGCGRHRFRSAGAGRIRRSHRPPVPGYSPEPAGQPCFRRSRLRIRSAVRETHRACLDPCEPKKKKPSVTPEATPRKPARRGTGRLAGPCQARTKKEKPGLSRRAGQPTAFGGGCQSGIAGLPCRYSESERQQERHAEKPRFFPWCGDVNARQNGSRKGKIAQIRRGGNRLTAVVCRNRHNRNAVRRKHERIKTLTEKK